MKIRKPIRNLSSKKDMPPRVFDVIIDGSRIELEVKLSNKKIEKIPWDDVVYQVELAKNTQQFN